MLSRKIIFILILAGVFTTNCKAQDSAYAHKIIDTLTSPYFFGRGYVNNGDTKAAAYVADKFYESHLSTYQHGFFQSFMMDVNTFPEK